MCTELLPPGGYPAAVNKYIISIYRHVGKIVIVGTNLSLKAAAAVYGCEIVDSLLFHKHPQSIIGRCVIVMGFIVSRSIRDFLCREVHPHSLYEITNRLVL
jgi:hypothetical protein